VPTRTRSPRRAEAGNIIFFVLLAIFLIGLVTMALRSNDSGDSQIDAENLSIAASDVKQYAHEVESALAYVMQNNPSESDIGFAYDSSGPYGDINAAAHPEWQVFSPKGGGAEYKDPPDGITVTPGQKWEFYAFTRIPGAGSDRADLIMALPGVTKAFCDRINQNNDQTAAPEEDGAGCLSDTSKRFNGTYEDTSPNLLDTSAASFSHTPALQACVNCGTPAAPNYVFYDVLMAR
jgi:hypothetical protein